MPKPRGQVRREQKALAEQLLRKADLLLELCDLLLKEQRRRRKREKKLARHFELLDNFKVPVVRSSGMARGRCRLRRCLLDEFEKRNSPEY